MFRKQTISLPDGPVEYPSGMCVRANGTHYYINGAFKHPVTSPRILLSWSFPRIIETSDEALAKYVTTKKLGFRDGTLVKNLHDGRLYFISKGLKRPVTNPDALASMGLGSKDAILISLEESSLHKIGEVLK